MCFRFYVILTLLCSLPGWFRPDDLFAWLHGSWYNQTNWTLGLNKQAQSEQRRNAFVFHFQPSSSTHTRVSVLPLLLVAPCDRLPETLEACDEAYRGATTKRMVFAYSNLIQTNHGAAQLQDQHCHLTCSHVSIALDSLTARTCLILLRFAASLDKKHSSSSEISMTFKAHFIGDLYKKDKAKDSDEVWRVTGLERIPADQTYQHYLVDKWRFKEFSLLAPIPGSFKY
jgi:hypothetical protein